MPFGLLLDLWECHKQYNGQATPAREHMNRIAEITANNGNRLIFRFKDGQGLEKR